MPQIVDGIHDITMVDRRKNPTEELIISWIGGALSEFLKRWFFF